MHSYFKHLILLITIVSLSFYANDPIQMTINSMTLKEKIGHLIIAAGVSNEERNEQFMATSPYRMNREHIEQLIQTYHIGGIIFLGTSFTHELQDRIRDYQKISKRPLLIALDAEWPAMRLKNLDPSLELPHHMTLGALTDNTLIKEVGKVIGLLMSSLGVHINLAPVMDVNNNSENPVINDRSFGSNPELVAQKGVAYAQGLQEVGIIACAKHFPGHGDTKIDSHYALPQINHDRVHLESIELLPFKYAIQNGVMGIMTAHLHVPHLDESAPATLSRKITTNLLRDQWGFEGLIITDGLGMRAVTDSYAPGQLEVLALQAGADILLCPVDVPKAIDAIEQAVLNGTLLEDQINQKLLRILQAKKWAFDQVAREQLSFENLLNRSAQLKKTIYEQAITIAQDCEPKPVNVIFSITQMNKFRNQNYGILQKTLEALKQLKQKLSNRDMITTVLYGSPYAAALVKEYSDRVLVAYEDDPDAHAAVDAIVSGTAQARGMLPV